MDKDSLYLITAFVLAFICPVRLRETACPPGATWSDCSGCWSRCPSKDMVCSRVCKEDCSCDEIGFVIHEGACIPLYECPEYALKLPCPPGAKWSSCSGCGSYCPAKDEFCLDVCEEGCVCEEPGLVIHDGACIPRSDCPDTEIKDTSCPPGAKWSTCAGCGSYCPVKDVFCATVCQEGCVCEKHGFVIHEGACIPLNDCPGIEIKEPTCPPGAKWSNCSGCRSYCPAKDRVCRTVCEEGCVCEEHGFVIHKGACIPRSDCPDTKIKKPTCPPGAKWSNCSGCGSYCPAKDTVCTAVCEEGCVCEEHGFVIHEGACIPRRYCPKDPLKERPCPPGAKWSWCSGCQFYCPVEDKVCTPICVPGCVCEEQGFVIHNDTCIPASECPEIPKTESPCPPGARMSDCAGCWSHCPTQDMSCSTMCTKGCVCTAEGHVIYKGVCIPASICPSVPTKALTCPPGARPYDCAGCWSFCPIRDVACPAVCQEGCACTQKGYVIHQNACIPANECPIIPKPGRPCPPQTQWAHCSSCRDYCPVIGRQCDQVCRIGCVCKKKTHVLYKGKCIPLSMCPQSFEDVPACPQHAIWSSCPKCESYCVPKNDCKNVCRGGCVCRKKGYVLHEGNCIHPDECPHV